MQAGEGSLAIGVPAQSGFETEVIEHRGPQIKRKVMDLFQHLSDRLDAFFEAASEGVLAGIFERRVEIQFGNSETLTDFIVQFASDASALAFLDFDEPMRECLEFVARATPFQFALFESLRHQVECEGEPAQFVAAVTKTGSRGEIAHRKTRAGVNECFDRTDNQEIAADPAECN